MAPTQAPTQLTPQVILRTATERDSSELARLRWDFSPDEVQASGQTYADFTTKFGVFLAQALASGMWVVWVAEQMGRLIGNIYVETIAKVPRPGRFNARYGYVTNVYIDAASRGQRIGTALLKQVIAWAQEQNLEFLIVWLAEDSINYYERCGFTPVSDAMQLFLDNCQ